MNVNRVDIHYASFFSGLPEMLHDNTIQYHQAQVSLKWEMPGFPSHSRTYFISENPTRSRSLKSGDIMRGDSQSFPRHRGCDMGFPSMVFFGKMSSILSIPRAPDFEPNEFGYDFFVYGLYGDFSFISTERTIFSHEQKDVYHGEMSCQSCFFFFPIHSHQQKTMKTHRPGNSFEVR